RRYCYAVSPGNVEQTGCRRVGQCLIIRVRTEEWSQINFGRGSVFGYCQLASGQLQILNLIGGVVVLIYSTLQWQPRRSVPIVELFFVSVVHKHSILCNCERKSTPLSSG